jgi:hypothetical protein
VRTDGAAGLAVLQSMWGQEVTPAPVLAAMAAGCATPPAIERAGDTRLVVWRRKPVAR